MTYKSFNKQKINIAMVCAHARSKQKQDGIEHAGYMSRSGWPVRSYSTSGTFFLFFVQQTFKILQQRAVFHLFNECMPLDGLFNKKTV